MLPGVRLGGDGVSDLARDAEAARLAILNAQRGIRVWEMDPTGTYTATIRRGADEAVGYLEEAVRRGQLALDALVAAVVMADAQRGVRVEADAQGVLDTSG